MVMAVRSTAGLAQNDSLTHSLTGLAPCLPVCLSVSVYCKHNNSCCNHVRHLTCLKSNGHKYIALNLVKSQ